MPANKLVRVPLPVTQPRAALQASTLSGAALRAVVQPTSGASLITQKSLIKGAQAVCVVNPTDAGHGTSVGLSGE